MTNMRNAIIERIEITNADHGVLTAWVYLNYGGSGQGFGGFMLYSPKSRLKANYAGHFLWRVMEVVGVSEWSQLVGQAVRVQMTDGLVYAIGNILEERWFYPREEFSSMGD